MSFTALHTTDPSLVHLPHAGLEAFLSVTFSFLVLVNWTLFAVMALLELLVLLKVRDEAPSPLDGSSSSAGGSCSKVLRELLTNLGEDVPFVSQAPQQGFPPGHGRLVLSMVACELDCTYAKAFFNHTVILSWAAASPKSSTHFHCNFFECAQPCVTFLPVCIDHSRGCPQVTL